MQLQIHVKLFNFKEKNYAFSQITIRKSNTNSFYYPINQIGNDATDQTVINFCDFSLSNILIHLIKETVCVSGLKVKTV